MVPRRRRMFLVASLRWQEGGFTPEEGARHQVIRGSLPGWPGEATDGHGRRQMAPIRSSPPASPRAHTQAHRPPSRPRQPVHRRKPGRQRLHCPGDVEERVSRRQKRIRQASDIAVSIAFVFSLG